MNRIAVILSLLFALLTGFHSIQNAHAQATMHMIELDDYFQETVVGRNALSVYEDTNDQQRIEHILKSTTLPFVTVTRDTTNFGHTNSSIWAHFSVKDISRQSQPKTWFLELEYPLLQRVNIYLVENRKLIETYEIGYSLPMGQRSIQHRHFTQPLTLEPGTEYDVYLNIIRPNGSIQLPLKLYRPSAFLMNELRENYVFGLFFGILLAMIIYNLYLFMAVGSRAYLYYLLYISCVAIAFLTTTGYGFLFLWHQSPTINEYALQIPSCLTVIMGMQFLRHFVKSPQQFPTLDRFISISIVTSILMIGLRLLTDYFLSEAITLLIAVISVITPILVYQCWRQGSRPAGFFLLAWSILLVGTTLYTLTLLGILPSNQLTNNGIFVGAAMETLLLSLGLADRINGERKAKYKALSAQHDAIMRLQESEHRQMHNALHSTVTGLPNRTFLRTFLEGLIASKHDRFTLILLSLNNFHEFNRTLGHSNGESILYQISKRANQSCQNQDTIATLESSQETQFHLAEIENNTYAIVLKQCEPTRAQEIALRQLTQFELPLEYNGLTLDIDGCVSLAFYPEHGKNSETLIRNAHIALEAAMGNNEKLAVYSKDIDPYDERRISLLGELRNAIEKDTLQLYFQPQIDLKTDQVIGAEVLLRWFHPEYGFISPDEFIPLAERTGVIRTLTYWVCRQAFQFQSDLQKQGFAIYLSINISARNLQDAEFKKNICHLAVEQNISLENIIMELTETAIMTKPDDALNMMNELSASGVRLSIDDFGTGYSSLSYLKRLPVEEIKIDRSFVMDLAHSNDDQLLVRTTMSMGHNLKLGVVAEGIEDEQTLQILKSMGCDTAQGYHIARPMSGEHFIEWIQAFHKKPDSQPLAK